MKLPWYFVWVGFAFAQTNLVLNRSVSSSLLWPGTLASWAVDGDLSTNFTADLYYASPWLQVDLGQSSRIGRVELVARKDGNQPQMRSNFAIEGSQDSAFANPVWLAGQGVAVSGDSASTWVGWVSDTGTYRYLRVQRLNNAGHFVFAEFRAYAYDGTTQNTFSWLVPQGNSDLFTGVKVFVNKNSAHVLFSNANDVGGASLTTQAWNFGQGQGWSLVASANNALHLVNAASGLSVDMPAGASSGTGVNLWGYHNVNNQDWVLQDAGAGFHVIQSSQKSSLCLMDQGGKALVTTCDGSAAQAWWITDVYLQNPPHASTDWLHAGRYGLAMSMIPFDTNSRNSTAQFATDSVTHQLVDAGANWLVFGIGQNSGLFVVPMPVYESYLGVAPYSRGSRSDVIDSLSLALHARGIKLIVYIPCQPSWMDATAFGLPANGQDQPVTMDFCLRWAQVLQELSDRWGTKVDGWWLDGGYASLNFRDEYFSVYASALKHGNHDAIVTFNPGIAVETNSSAEDYTAGETWDTLSTIESMSVPTQGRFLNGEQWHQQTYFGVEGFGGRVPRFTPQTWIQHMQVIFAQGGTIEMDVGANWNGTIAPIGTISDSMMTSLRQIRAAFYSSSSSAPSISSSSAAQTTTVLSKADIIRMARDYEVYDMLGRVQTVSPDVPRPVLRGSFIIVARSSAGEALGAWREIW